MLLATTLRLRAPLPPFSAGARLAQLARRRAPCSPLCTQAAQAAPASAASGAEGEDAPASPPTEEYSGLGRRGEKLWPRRPKDPNAPHEFKPRPSMTARARWLRMEAALKIVAAEGCELEEAERRVWEQATRETTEPGVVGAVMSVLREQGPLQSAPLYEAIAAKYPRAAAELGRVGRTVLIQEGTHRNGKRVRRGDAIAGLEKICDYPLRNKLMKVRSRPKSEAKQPGYAGKDSWALRRRGQVRRWHARQRMSPDGKVVFNRARGRIYGHHA